MMLYMKQFAPKVLAVWLASWAIVMLQPCCESFLEPSQSHHGSQDSGHQIDHQHAETTHHDSAHDCKIAIENLDDLTAPVTETFLSENKYQPDSNTIISYDGYPVLSKNHIVLYVYHYTHPPPGKTQVYFKTLRIRV